MASPGEISFIFSPPVAVVRQLMREYAESLGIDLQFQNFEAELANLPGRYAEPEGCLIVASVADLPAACGAFRRLNEESCEMKRLYVRPEFRGHSLGRKIAEQLMGKAAEAGYRAMRLDTLPFMGAAIKLYRSLGFQEIEPYYTNPISGTVFLEAKLPVAFA